jgi:Tfp pilus tip-associated adhesin PilY1
MIRMIDCRIGRNAQRIVCIVIMALCSLAWFDINRQALASNDWTQPAMADYVKVPPFISYAVKPNIMIVLDNSGSMNGLAYGGDFTGEPYNGIYSSTRSFFVAREIDDMQESAIGLMSDTGTLALGSQLVGLRFQDVNIPQGAKITSAYIRFTAASNGTASGMQIWGEAIDDAPFIDETVDSNLSGRDRSVATADWTVDEWMADLEYDTPDLSAVLQAIVSRQNWASGNALLLGISPGAGTIQAQAHLRDSDDPDVVVQIGAVLHIEFESINPGFRYYGYYNPDYFYEYNSNAYFPKFKKINFDYNANRWNVENLSGVPSTLNDAQIAPTIKSQGLWDGNWMNWLSMRRIDVMRKVLLGGKATSRTGTGNQQNIAEDGVSTGYPVHTRPFSSTNGSAVSPYKGTFNYEVRRGGTIYVSSTSYKNVVQKDVATDPQDFLDGNLAGVLQRVGDRARWGNMWFNSGTGTNGSGGFVDNAIDNGFSTNMMTTIQNKSCDTWTPLAETFYVAMQYFAQEPVATGLHYPGQSQLFSIGKGTHKDPFWDKDESEYIPCAKSFTLLLTDGASTRDSKVPSPLIGYAQGENIPEDLREYTHFDPETSGQACPDESKTCNYASGGTDYLADLALYARTNDLRPDLTCYDNNLVLYPIFAFGQEGTQEYINATALLKKAALLGGYGDSNNDGNPDTYYEANDGYLLEKELMRAINDILSRTSSGTAASVVSSSRSGEGAVYQSIFYPSLTDSLGNNINWAGQVNALLVDAHGNLREDTTGDHRLDIAEDLFVVFSSAERDPDDPCPPKDGDRATVRKFKDINANGIFDDEDLDEGPVTVNGKSVFELHEINFLWSSGDWLNSPDLDPVNQRNYGANDSRRHIFTFVDADGSMVVKSDQSVKDFVALADPTWAQVTDPADFFAYMHVYEPFIPPISPTHSQFQSMVARQARRVVNFIRGQDQAIDQVGSVDLHAMRNRKVDHNGDGEELTWRLGDIVYSSPTLVGRPAENFDLIYKDASYTAFYRKYRHRRNVLYMGSNGGMLHAFNGGFFDEVEKQFVLGPVNARGETVVDGTSYSNISLGAELWAYIPFNLLPHLYWLTKPDYEHVYYMDLEPRVFDARIFANDEDHPNGWGTVLVAGMRFGGGKIAADIVKDAGPYDPAVDRTMSSAYAVFDITNPEKKPRLLAELTFPELGFTTCHPGVIPMRGFDDANQETTNQWYLIFGSGPVSPDAFGEQGANTDGLVDGTSTQKAVMYAVDLVELAGGELVMLTESGPQTYSNAAGVGPFYLVQFDEPDSSVSKPIVVDWDLDFNADTVYFGTSSGNHTDGWSGKMRRLVLDTGTNDPTEPTQWVRNNTMLNLMAGDNKPLMTTGQPIMAPATAATDKAANRWLYFGTGRFYSQPDKLNVEQQSYYGIKEPSKEVDGERQFDYSTVGLGDLMDVSNINVFENGEYLQGYAGSFRQLADDIEENHAGWRLNFPDAGERNLGQAVLAGEVLTFTTFTPSDDVCASDGQSQLYALYYRTGTAYIRSIFGLNYGENSPEGDPLVLKRRSLGSGMTTTPNIQVGRQGVSVFIQTESGGIEELDQQTPGAVKSGKLVWTPDEVPEECLLP